MGMMNDINRGFEHFVNMLPEDVAEDFKYIKMRCEVLCETPIRKYLSEQVRTESVVDDTSIERAKKCVEKIKETQKNDDLFADISDFKVFSVVYKENYYGKNVEIPVKYHNASIHYDIRSEGKKENGEDNFKIEGHIISSNTFLSKFTDKELLFVMGHEMAHASLYHLGSENVLMAYTKDEALFNKHKRACEHQADMLGTYFAVKAGGDLQSCISAMKKLSSVENSVIDSYCFWETHPTKVERISFVKNRYSEDYVRIMVNSQNFAKKLAFLKQDDPKFQSKLDDIKNDILSTSSFLRKGNGYFKEHIDSVREYISENPKVRGAKVYFDTREMLSAIKKDEFFAKFIPERMQSYAVKYQKDEIKLGTDLAKEVLKMPEVSLFKGVGLKNLLSDTKTDTQQKSKNGRDRV